MLDSECFSQFGGKEGIDIVVTSIQFSIEEDRETQSWCLFSCDLKGQMSCTAF